MNSYVSEKKSKRNSQITERQEVFLLSNPHVIKRKQKKAWSGRGWGFNGSVGKGLKLKKHQDVSTGCKKTEWTQP